ncbi:hypothetical protein G4H71_06195 [Rhodococcus triatomae]|uniref:hypothetical protein n=1 Tax=Rhodococcus triatomae TaxID=300028 RepID=UPI0009F5DC89|nr:hypothetical protein [Rhodococcus triatomae]QNG17653.1 hypothetical protein G4H72_01850 [Rhodococcus triatomae]QNG22680.1 hypothetical protein G4H71_06195 [Rhodococcus triatomae]
MKRSSVGTARPSGTARSHASGTAQSRASGTAPLRGGLVGSVSGALSIAAHGIGGGHAAAMSTNSLALLVAACGAVGAIAGSARTGHRLLHMAALLLAGQGAGHVSLSLTSGHDPLSSLTPAMTTAHVLAAVVAAAAIAAAERGGRRALARLRRLRPALLVVASPDETPRSAPDFTYHPRVVLRLLAGSGAGTRGPPSRLALALT